jgi:hypothetical protein
MSGDGGMEGLGFILMFTKCSHIPPFCATFPACPSPISPDFKGVNFWPT